MVTREPTLSATLASCPLVAILRGITPAEAVAVGAVLIEEGVRTIEVPLNSPEPFVSIGRLAKAFGHKAMIGAGTVTSPRDADMVIDVGGRLIVMPHFDPRVLQAAKQHGAYVVPGVATPSEAFAALAAGADGLKLFPAEMITPTVLKSLRAVLPDDVKLIPVGGISADNIPAYRAAGATAYGIGSTLYAPGRSASAVRAAVRRLLAAVGPR